MVQQVDFISNSAYHADPAISASHLNAFATSPFHYWSKYRNPNRPPSVATAAMRLGSLVHCAVLEPDELSKRYALCPSRTTKAGKEKAAELEANGIEAVTDSDMELALAMSNAVRSHTVAGNLLREGRAEQSFWWDDLLTGLRCKCRPDWYHGSTIVDLKTTTDASPQGFAASVAKWRYHVQQAHYLSGTFADRFVFIAVEKTYPYGVGVYELDANARQQGELIRRKSLEQLNDCLIIDEWLGYTSAIESLSLPGWAFKSNDVMTSNDF